MNVVQKVIKSITTNFKSLGNNVENSSSLYYEKGKDFKTLLKSFFNFGGTIDGFVSKDYQRNEYCNNGTFSKVVNNVVDGVVSLPIRTESDDIPIDSNLLRSICYDYILGNGWVKGKALSGFSSSFKNTKKPYNPLNINFDYPRDDKMEINFDGNNNPVSYSDLKTGENDIDKQDKFDPSKDEYQYLQIFQINPLVSEKESYRGVGNFATQGLLLKASQERDTAEANVFGNKSIAGFLTNKSNIPLQPHIEKEVNEALKKKIGNPNNFNRLQYTNADLSFLKTSTDASDLKLLESEESHLRKMGAVVNLDSKILGNDKASTFNNMDTAEKSAYLKCYIPTAEIIITAINQFFNLDYKIFKDEIDILKKNNAESVNIILAQFNAGLIDKDEANDRIANLI